MIYLFKERDPSMSQFHGQEKIFMHHLCTGDKKAYGIGSINKIFETGVNTDRLQARMIDMMCELQKAHPSRSDTMPDWMLKYEGAEEEYPAHYEALVAGLSDKALDAIAAQKDVLGCAGPEDTGAIFTQRLREDRARFLAPNISDVAPDVDYFPA